jgi:hypothetical protein
VSEGQGLAFAEDSAQVYSHDLRVHGLGLHGGGNEGGDDASKLAVIRVSPFPARY